MESGTSFASLDLDGEDRFQRLRAELGVSTFGDLARVAPDLRRRLSNRTSEPLFVLAMGGANQHEGRDGRAYASWDEQGEGRAPADVPLREGLA